MKSKSLKQLISALALILATVTASASFGITTESMVGFYQTNRNLDRPNYITVDFWLQAYSLIRNSRQKTVEQQQIRPLFTALLQELDQSVPKNNDGINPANRDFIQVMAALLSGKTEGLSERAQLELQLVLAASGIAQSPLWGMSLDYSQFKPRGHYTETAEDKQYFQAMRYASSILFAIKPSAATGVSPELAKRMTAQATQLSHLLQASKTAAQIDQLLEWQMGPADDLTYADWYKVAVSLKEPTPEALQTALLAYAQQQHKQPKIFSGLVDVSKLEPNTGVADVLTGFRLLPLRFTAESAAFQNLLYPNSGDYKASCPKCPLPFGASNLDGKLVKGFPSAYELMALLGSPAAQRYVSEHKENDFSNYPAATQQAGQFLLQAQGVNASHLKVLKALFKTDANADPALQQKRLTAGLGFWTWQRYTGLLYSKQSYSLTSKSMEIPIKRPGARIERADAFYQALAELVNQHQAFTPDATWQEFASALNTAMTISKKAPSALTEQDTQFLNDLDKTLTGGELDHPIVVDIHTHPGEGSVVEEATGNIETDQFDKAVGPRFSHYEFKQPLSDRLDNETWREMLKNNRAPLHPVR